MAAWLQALDQRARASVRAKRGRLDLTTTINNDGQVRALVEKMLKSIGHRVDLSTPLA